MELDATPIPLNGEMEAVTELAAVCSNMTNGLVLLERQVFHRGRGAHEVFAKIPKKERRRKKRMMLTCGTHLS